MGIINFISININYAIGLSGIVLIIFILRNTLSLNAHRDKIDILINRKRKKISINKKTGEMNEYEEAENVTPETIRDYEKEFNRERSKYNIYTQLIPIFPLLGILGTVSGLMQQVAAEDMDAINASLNVALGSTFLGLIFAIVLKLIVVLWPGRIVDDIEIMLDNYYDKYSDAIAQKNISEE